MMDNQKDQEKLHIRIGIKTGEYSIGTKKSFVVITCSKDIFNQDKPENHRMFGEDNK